MDQATQTMIDNLHKNTGKTLEQWIEVVNKEKLAKHGEVVKFLKDKHSFTHGFANLVAHKANSTDAGSAANTDDLVTKQYAGKEQFLPLYQSIRSYIASLGNDVEFAPKNAYVSVRRKKQFAMLQPATKSRFELHLQLKGMGSERNLEALKGANAMCSHKINMTVASDFDSNAKQWLKKAYEMAG